MDKAIEFLTESNAIEGEFSKEALEDAKKAWDYAKKKKNYLQDVNEELILGIHTKLLKRLNPRIAGNIRDCDVYVGGRMGLDPEEIPEALKELCAIIPTNEEEIKDWHIKFEHIHPFEDGNGRTGRILMNIQRLKIGLPILVIYDAEKQDYYRWFQIENTENT